MEIIRAAIPRSDAGGKERRKVKVERQSLSKRRWRATADDGRELGFDLETALEDGAAVLETAEAVYVLAQGPETNIGLRIAECRIEEAARLGWMLGNLHFPVEIADGTMWTVDDPAVRQLMDREGIVYATGERVFKPLKAVHGHGH